MAGEFVIAPHMRLHEWVAVEKGYFDDESLVYVLEDQLQSATNPIRDLGDRVGAYQAHRFWEAVRAEDLAQGGLILNPDEFYILASREFVHVPPDMAAEMRAYDTAVGEFRAHYAGFFDPGFGCEEIGAQPTRAVLEVRSHDVPFVIEQAQTVCRLVYEPMAAVPDQLYGAAGSGSNYQSQGLKLAKHFID